MIEVSHLVKTFGRTSVLRDLSFVLPAKSFGVVIGKSGAGKSTLLHLIAGLDRPDSGAISIAGRPLPADPEALARLRLHQVGIVFQFFNLLPTLTVEANVALPGHLRGDARSALDARVSFLLDLVELADKRRRWPHELSGGELQRTAIARALVNSPSAILADEPTGNLDQTTGKAIADIFSRVVRESGATLLMVTHDPDLVSLADTVFQIRDGTIV